MDKRLVKLSIMVLGLNQEVLDMSNSDTKEFFRIISPIVNDEIVELCESPEDEGVLSYAFPVRKTYDDMKSMLNMDSFNKTKDEVRKVLSEKCPNDTFSDDELIDLVTMLNISSQNIVIAATNLWIKDKDTKAVVCLIPILNTTVDKITKYGNKIDDENCETPLISDMAEYIFEKIEQSLPDDVRMNTMFSYKSMKIKYN